MVGVQVNLGAANKRALAVEGGDDTFASVGFCFDPDIIQAQNVIYSTWGDRVSVLQKAKNLNKFGRTNNADTGAPTTVSVFQDAVVNETFATDNTIDYVVSTSGSDTEVITVEGHTIDTSTGDLAFTVQSVTLTGQTPVALTTPLARANRVYVANGTFASPASNLAGDVAVYDSTLSGGGVTAGKPDVDAAVKTLIQGTAGKNQSEKCASSISSSDYFIITEIYAACTRSSPQSATVDVEVEYREIGGVWRPLGFEINIDQGVSGYMHDEMRPYLIVPKNSDFRMIAISDSDNTTIAGYVNGYLAAVQ